MMDGGGALQLIEFLCDSEPDPSEPKEVDEAVRNARPGEIPSYQEKSVRAWQHMAEIPLNTDQAPREDERPQATGSLNAL
jgi:hypothetical protein